MKKNTIKAFTLVEMLIVIVIIGILIASLMPRMQAAQWRARDVARKNDLAQIQTAIISSQSDRRDWPENTNTGAQKGMAIAWNIEQILIDAWMSSVPTDPNGSNAFSWLGNAGIISGWKYGYMVSTRNGIPNGWFVLMAKTETEWWSNWVTCNSTGTSTLTGWYLKTGQDLKFVQTCQTLTKGSNANECIGNRTDCVYYETAELRYILLY